MSWNPDFDPNTAYVELNGIVRKIYDRRAWFPLMVRGQIATQGYIIGGSAILTAGSPTVQGIGTSWSPIVIGRQFRVGYNTPPMTIIAMNQFTQTLTLELPWAGVSYPTGIGYFIAQYYFNLGPNIKYVHTAKNLIMAWRLQLGYNQQSLDALDPWRINTFSPRALAQMPLGVNGEYMVELWPTPSIVQALPFIAVIQPPNITGDNSNFPAYIRSDIIAKYLIAAALVYRGPKLNKYYDSAESNRLRGEAESELIMMAMADENLYRQNLIYEWEKMSMAPDLYGNPDANYAINHGMAAADFGGYGR